MADEKPKTGTSFVGKLVVEIADPRNRNHLLHVSKEVVRGRWDRVNLIPDEHVEDLEPIPDVPGIAVEVIGEPRSIRIFDPLGTPDHQATMEALKKTRFGKDTGPKEDAKIPNPTDDDIKTWLYWLWRLTQIPVINAPNGRRMSGPAVKVIEGKIPTGDEINKLNGKIRRGMYDSKAGFRNESREVQHASA